MINNFKKSLYSSLKEKSGKKKIKNLLIILLSEKVYKVYDKCFTNSCIVLFCKNAKSSL